MAGFLVVLARGSYEQIAICEELKKEKEELKKKFEELEKKLAEEKRGREEKRRGREEAEGREKALSDELEALKKTV